MSDRFLQGVNDHGSFLVASVPQGMEERFRENAEGCNLQFPYTFCREEDGYANIIRKYQDCRFDEYRLYVIAGKACLVLYCQPDELRPSALPVLLDCIVNGYEFEYTVPSYEGRKVYPWEKPFITKDSDVQVPDEVQRCDFMDDLTFPAENIFSLVSAEKINMLSFVMTNFASITNVREPYFIYDDRPYIFRYGLDHKMKYWDNGRRIQYMTDRAVKKQAYRKRLAYYDLLKMGTKAYRKHLGCHRTLSNLGEIEKMDNVDSILFYPALLPWCGNSIGIAIYDNRIRIAGWGSGEMTRITESAFTAISEINRQLQKARSKGR